MTALRPKNLQPSTTLDGTDLAILAALVEDGRMTNAALAARVGVAESTCAYRVRALRDSGVIAGVTARLNLGALGHPIQAVIKVRLGSHDREHVRDLYDQLVRVPGVLTVLHVAGEDDFHLHVAVGSPENLRDMVLEHITIHPIVRQTQTQLVFEVREGRGVL
ncbi:MAG TPA: Lrp/AsnC family transcriptional regulator [Nocardioidaceae bacterium]|nr:Lrp/AsnC family transcriptional regulator [Nocardioidaceae bacterium]